MSQGKPAYEVQNITTVVAGSGFQAREFTVAPDEEVPWHYHTEVTDWCYCLEGVVAAQVRDRAAPGDVTLRRLAPGESCRIEPNTVHRLTSGSDGACRYLLLQAGGNYDFNKVDAAEYANEVAE